MNMPELCVKIAAELQTVLSCVDSKEPEELISQIQKAKNIFVAGAGRSKLILNAFAMRLMQIGLKVYVVGEIVTPAICPGDLLIIGSGSGRTKSMVLHAQTAKSLGVTVCLITTNRSSPLALMSDYSLVIPVSRDEKSKKYISFQPGGSLFEQSMMILLDAVILKIMETEDPAISVMTLHANLE